MNSFILYEKGRHIASFSRFFTFTFALVIFGSLNALAQQAPVGARFDPVPQETGDETSLLVDYGTEAEPVDDVTHITLSITYEGFDITSEPDLDLNNSWFCEDGGCTSSSFSIDNEQNLVTIELLRAEDDPKSGFGALVVMKGIIIDMEDIHYKSEPQIGVKKVQVEETLGSRDDGERISYEWRSQTLRIEGLEPGLEGGLEIVDLAGKVVFRTRELFPEMQVELRARHIYVVRMKVEDRVYQQKLFIQP